MRNKDLSNTIMESRTGSRSDHDSQESNKQSFLPKQKGKKIFDLGLTFF